MGSGKTYQKDGVITQMAENGRRPSTQTDGSGGRAGDGEEGSGPGPQMVRLLRPAHAMSAVNGIRAQIGSRRTGRGT